MKIIADFTINEKYSPSVSAYMEELWLSLAGSYPAGQFLFVSTRQPREAVDLPPNVLVKPITKTGIAWWDRQRMLRLLNDWKADRYVVMTRYAMEVKTPRKKYNRSHLRRPGALVFLSGIHRAMQPEGHVPIYVISPAVRYPVAALSWTETESIKTQYTAGRDFFLFTGDIDEYHRLIELLKAFSIFKKWQQSNMQLVIAGNSTSWTEWFQERLATYKYRDDVVLLTDLPDEETTRLIAACYALVYPSVEAVLPLPVINAAAAGVAAIVSDTPINREAVAAAAWIDNSNLEEGFGQAMISLYKDEAQKQEIVRQIKAATHPYAWNDMTQAVWKIIQGE